MSYCTIDDVQSVFKTYTFGTNTKVTASEITNDIIPEMDRWIDDRLGRYYQTPITGTNALLTLNRIEKYLVAAEVARRTYVGQGPNTSPQATEWQTLAENDFTAIIKGDIILYDATPTGETPESKLYLIQDNLSQPMDPCNVPKFKSNMSF